MEEDIIVHLTNTLRILNSFQLRSETDVAGEEEGSAQYLTANCLLLTYFNGDAANLVDAHFDRALHCDKTSPSDKTTSPCDKQRDSSGETSFTFPYNDIGRVNSMSRIGLTLFSHLA